MRKEGFQMKFDELFEQRSLIASKLDKLLNGSIDNKKSFDRHLQKILKLLNMSADDLIFYCSVSVKSANAMVFSKNAPVNHEMSGNAKKQYDLLLDVIDLCTIYY